MAADSAVIDRIWLKFELIRDVIRIEDAGVATTLKIDFSNIQGQLTPQSRVKSGSNSMPFVDVKMSRGLIKIRNLRYFP